MHIKDIYNKYKEANGLLKDLKVEKKLYKALSSLLITIFIISAPLLITINLFIFYDYYPLFIFIIFLLIDLTYILTKKFYYQQVFKEINNTISLKNIYFFEQLIFLIVFIVFYVIIISYIGW